MMNRLRDQAQAWWREQRAAILVEVVKVAGSAPRHPGTRMLVDARECLGTIGGGHLEWTAIQTARQWLLQASFPEAMPPVRYPLGPSLGQCCGGVVWLRYRRLDDAALAQWPDEAPRLTVAVFGAGHVGSALVSLLASLPCAWHWFDTGPQEDGAFDTPEARHTPEARRTPEARHTPEAPAKTHAGEPSAPCPRLSEDALADLATLPDGCHVLVMTHSHALDFAIIEAALRSARFASVGVIGSATKARRFHAQLIARGLDEATAQRLICPIGMPGIEGREPAVIALAVAAQLMAAPPTSTGCDTSR